MSLRIEKRIGVLNETVNFETKFQDYLGRLVKMIPGEIVGLYMIGSGFIAADRPALSSIWVAFCFLMIILSRILATKDANTGKPQRIAIVISSIAFLIWVYWMGGPFNTYIPTDRPFASLFVLAWTFIVPLFYKGDPVTVAN